MSVYRKLLLQVLPLILVLLAGQLQASTVCSCPMMDKNTSSAMMGMGMQDEGTCYHDHKGCLGLDCDDTTSLIFVLSINQDIQMNAQVPDLSIESDIDPPQLRFTTLNLVFPSQVITAFLGLPQIERGQSGSKIHLITQRLRI